MKKLLIALALLALAAPALAQFTPGGAAGLTPIPQYRIPYADPANRYTNSASFTFNGTTVTVPALTATGNVLLGNGATDTIGVTGITTLNGDGTVGANVAAGLSLKWATGGTNFGIFDHANAAGAWRFLNSTRTQAELDGNGRLALPTTGDSAGILIGGDTLIYSSAGTDAQIETGGAMGIGLGNNEYFRICFNQADCLNAAASALALQLQSDGELLLKSTGGLTILDAGGASDIVLTRAQQDVLQLADVFTATEGIAASPQGWAVVNAAPPSSAAGILRFANDTGSAGGMYWRYVPGSTRWAPINGSGTLASLGAPTSGVANTETLQLQTLLPIGTLQNNDSLLFTIAGAKSGATDSLTLRIRIGTAGDTSDALVYQGDILGAAGRSFGGQFEIKVLSTTTVQKVGAAGTAEASYAGASTTAETSTVAISSHAANALYVSVFILSSGAADTVGLQSARIQLVTP